METDHYFTIEKPATGEFRDRGSRFIAYAYPINDVLSFREKLAYLKKEHAKAVHHCFAYRIGTSGDVFRVTDDGEPSGSAGRPILGQVDTKNLTNTLVIVVRYFGGTLLGIPGLINAYKTAAAAALDAAGIVQKPIRVFYKLRFDYTKMNDVMRILKQYDCLIQKQEMQLFCEMETGIAKKQATEAENKLKEMHGVDMELIQN
jgi:uncharacterized YigZ family protein